MPGLVLATLMFGNAGAMALRGAQLPKRRLLLYLFALAVLAVNIVLTFTDQVGALDFVAFAVDLVLLGVLTVARTQFLGGEVICSVGSRAGRMDPGGRI